MSNISTYAYTAWSTNEQREVSAQIAAASSEDAKAMLESSGYTVLDLQEVGASTLGKREFSFRKKLALKDLAWIMRQLAIYQTAGLPIAQAISNLARQRGENSVAGKALSQMHASVVAGQNLADAFAEQEEAFGPTAVSLVAAGVRAGRLEDAFEQAAALSEGELDLRRKVRSALSYPLAVMALALVLVFVMLTFVVPSVKRIYTSLGSKLPVQTRVLIDASNVVRDDLWVVVLLVVLAVVAYRRWRSVEANAVRVDRLKVRIPLVGPILYKTAVARVVSTMAGMISAGVPTINVIEQAVDVVGLKHLSVSMRAIAERVRRGDSLSVAMASEQIWPPLLVQMIHVGEEAGGMDGALRRYAQVSNDEVKAAIEQLINMIEPLSVAVIGSVIGAMIISLYLPIFDIIKVLNKQAPQ